MRDVLAVAGVIVVALGLGGVAAYMSVDLTPPGLELIRPLKPAVAERIQREEKQRTIQAQASECKYCVAVAELAQTFSRRAEAARTHATALQAALPQISDETEQTAGRLEELKAAQTAASRSEAAAVVLTGWASRCKSEDMCKAAPTRVAASCVGVGDPRPAAALLIAMTVRNAAQTCASASCPAIDCQASGALRSDMGQIEDVLDDIGGRAGAVPGQSTAQLPVGASTLKAELTRITDETSYVTKMLPLLLDKSKATEKKLPKLAPEMADERAISAAQLASVMEQAAAVSDSKADPRHEAAWRLKSLATNLAALGRDALPASNGALSWDRIADSLGGALLDLARLQAMLDRVSKDVPASADCDGSVASAAQQLREAAAMLDHCRMRSACVGRGGAGGVVHASTGDVTAAFDRAKTAAEGLRVNEIGEQKTLQVAEGNEPNLIDVLRSQGVCRRAGELREAAAVAPVVVQNVAAAAVPPALSILTPVTGAVAPQDVVAGAVQAAVNATPIPESVAPAGTLVQAAARYTNVTPRRKPRLLSADPSVMQVAAPPTSRDGAYQGGGVIFPSPVPQQGTAFGGEGGPVQTTPPAEVPASDSSAKPK